MSKLNKYKSGINPVLSWPIRDLKSPSFYIEGLARHDRFVLSECITLLESKNREKRSLGVCILNQIPQHYPETIRIGITGTPGVGKSTFIESFGLFLIANGKRPAILAIDPSSQKTKGSILGDKTRMELLSTHPNAFIRPTATGGVFGGTSSNTKEIIQVCESAGYDIIIVETVGVGQSETEVDDITDINILLLQPGAGDDMQGIKRGIVENADIFIINKSDGALISLAKSTKEAYKNAIQLFHHKVEGWNCPIILCSAIENKGNEEVYSEIIKFCSLTKAKGVFYEQRKLQELLWFEKQTVNIIKQHVLRHLSVHNKYKSVLSLLKKQTINTSEALTKMEKAISDLLDKGK